MDRYFQQILTEIISNLGGKEERPKRIAGAFFSLVKYFGPESFEYPKLKEEFLAKMDALPGEGELESRIAKLSDAELDELVDWISGLVFEHNWAR